MMGGVEIPGGGTTPTGRPTVTPIPPGPTPPEYNGGSTAGTPAPNYPKVAYEVKIGAFKNANPTELIKLNRYGNVYSEPAGQYKRYKVGAFKTLAEAEQVRAKIIRETGLYKDAQITKTTSAQLISEVLVNQSINTESSQPTNGGSGTVIPPGGRDKEQFTPTTTTPTTSYDALDVVVYKVQLGAYSNPKYFDQSKVAGLGRVEQNSKQLPNGKQLTIFLLGNFPNKSGSRTSEKESIAKRRSKSFCSNIQKW